jgi:hypothetical protein
MPVRRPSALPSQAWLTQAVREGLSARAAYRAFQQAGFGLREEIFRSIYRAAQHALAQQQAVAQIAPDLPVTAPNVGEWHANVRGRFAYQVSVIMEKAFAPGEVRVEPFTLVTDRPVRPEVAIRQALLTYSPPSADVPEGEGSPNNLIHGAVITGVYRVVAPGE